MKEEEGEEPRVLLLQRASTDSAPLAWELPGGGCGFDEDDDSENETVLSAVARELWEETGLAARSIDGLVVPRVIDGRKGEGGTAAAAAADDGWEFPEPQFGLPGEEGGGAGPTRRPLWRLLCFLVTVEVAAPAGEGSDGGGVKGSGGDTGRSKVLLLDSPPPAVELDPVEHCASVWATEGDVKKGDCCGVKLEWGGGDQRKDGIHAGFRVLREQRLRTAAEERKGQGH
ncbi:hypothetical protein C7999DRAFT_28888 [Corynascus novoguineensis]|uniref:Nudix hydrolase domain-containing protein n=1 Tax=Corynascus novoguineensis TaxID=1126955 RepID=A0AAN7CYS7_9PEZI|nr:hypothetical protein C7999DRAFT_28888 [Corynascus novoguineensis]